VTRERARRVSCLKFCLALSLLLASRPACGVQARGAAGGIPVGGPAGALCPDVKLLDAWYERVFVGGYRQFARHGLACDRDAEAFVRAMAPEALYGADGVPVDDLLGRSRRLLEAGCDDPLIVYLAARLERDADRDSRRSIELFEQAVEKLGKKRYPRVVAFRAAEGARAAYQRNDEAMGKQQAIAPVELRWFLEAVDDGSFAKGETVVLLRHCLGEFYTHFSQNRAAIVGAVESRPWVESWARLFLAGERASIDAWDARGHRYSNRVTEEGWKGFEASLKVARDALTASWEARKDRPEAATAMISVAMAAPRGDTPRLWFDRAVQARFDHVPAYEHLINALRTRWTGDPDALPAFARACAETRRFDTRVPMMALEAIEQREWDLVDEARPTDPESGVSLPLPDHERPPSVYRDPEVYSLVAAVLERYRREPGQPDWRRFSSLQSAIAFKAGRYEDARRFLHDSGGVLTREARDTVSVPMLEPRIEAYAGREGETIRRAEALYAERRTSEVVPLLEKAVASSDLLARPYLERELAMASTEGKLDAGEAVRFMPDPGLPGWLAHVGTWSVEKDGSLLGTSAARGLLIVAEARVGPDFGLDADVEITSTSNGQYQMGIVFGEAPAFWSNRWSSFRWKRTASEGEVAYFSKHFARPPRPVAFRVPLRNHVVVQSRSGRLSVWLNGQPVVTDYVPEWSPPRGPDNQVGFGGYVDDNVYSVRIRRATLRRLASTPRAPEAR
jgi:hypothetical protein